MIDLLRAAPHVALHKDQTFVVKIGGACLKKPSTRRALLQALNTVHALGSKLVLVHGGGPQTNEVSQALGEEPRFVAGRRVTTKTGLRALRMATAGEVHGELLAALTECGAPAVGVAGASSNLVVAAKRPPVEIDGEIVDFGAVGDVVSVDVSSLVALTAADKIPVVCPPAGDGAGGLLNVNADVMAAEIAIGLGAAKLLLLTDAAGIMEDFGDEHSLLSVCSLAELEALEARGSIAGGMRVKAASIARALRAGVPRVHVVSGLDDQALLTELYTNQGSGTLITLQSESAQPNVAPSKQPASV